MKKKSKLIIAITLMSCILISITFITLNKQVKQKSVANNPIASDTNKEKSDDEKDNSKKTDSEKKASEEDTSNESEEAKDNSDKKDDIVNNLDENKSKDVNTAKINSDDSEANNSNSNEKPVVEESAPTPPAEKQPAEKYVTLSITTNTILNNMDKVSAGKKDIIPSNGVILGEVKVKIEDGDTVFDILKRETRKNRIHMDFVESPLYGSAYIKGIANIYEFDAGDLSGWMYSVNGVFPGYGASKYKVENGDVIKWQYTCDLGRDLGNEF